MRGKQRFFRGLVAVTAWGIAGSVAFAGSDGGWRTARGAMVAKGQSTVQVRSESATGDTQRLVYRFPAPVVAPLADGTVDVSMPSTEASGTVGAPALPTIPAHIAVPQGHEIVDVTVIPGAAHEVRLNKPVRQVQQAYPLSKPETIVKTPRDPRIYGSDGVFPAERRRFNGLQSKRGVGFADLLLSPVAYRPRSNRLIYYEELTVEVRTRPFVAAVPKTGGKGQGAAPASRRCRFRGDRDREANVELIDNPETLATYVVEKPVSLVAAAPSASSSPAPRPMGISGDLLPCTIDDYRYVIVTTAWMDGDFYPILDLRRAQGLTAITVTMDDILKNYPNGKQDDAQSLRDFIRDAYNLWGTEYVLLGGGAGVLPFRYLHAKVGTDTEDNIPSDLYFQCLDGSFDSNGNGVFGEPDDGADRMDGHAGTDIDLYAEVAIGRIPVEDYLEADNWVWKQEVYEIYRHSGQEAYLRGAIMAGEHLGFGGISEYAGPSMEEIHHGANTNGYRTAGFTSLDIFTNILTVYASPTFSWNGNDLADIVNTEQYSVINHLGHCNYDYCMQLYATEMDGAYRNDLHPMFLYSQGCYPGAFDYGDNCIGVHMLGANEYQFFGAVLNSRFGWGSTDSTDGPSQRYNRWFWHAFFGEMTPFLGLLNQAAHERNAARINEDCMRWCYYESNLLGDPAQMLYGIDSSVRFVRGDFSTDAPAYRSTTNANVEVLWSMADPAVTNVTVSLQMMNGTNLVAQTNIVCRRVGATGRLGQYTGGPAPLAALSASNGMLLVATWTNPASIVYRDTAPIDDVPPVITNLRITGVTDASLTVGWDTDEPAAGGAGIGKVLPPNITWLQQAHAGWITNHFETFNGLSSFTRYYATVWAEDGACNRTVVPIDPLSVNPVDYLTGATRGRQPTAAFDFNLSDGGWVASNINGQVCWEYGQSTTYGPSDGTFCWGTILNDRYPAGANATVSSPPFAVQRSPLIQFRQWYDIRQTGVYDVGYIEVFATGVWNNVTRYTDVSSNADFISGTSGGWQDVKLYLPAAYEETTLRLRFRFASDNTDPATKPAGWYITDVAISDVPDSGLGISGCTVTDTGTGLSGNGNGFPDPGETVALRLRTFNYTTNVIRNVRGTFVLQITGNPSVLAVLPDGSPATVTYGDIQPMDGTNSVENVRVQLASGLPYGTTLTILQTLVDAQGNTYETRYDLPIDPIVQSSGRVRDIVTHAPISNVVVTATQGNERFATHTDTNGVFVFNGLYSNAWYTFSAYRVDGYMTSNLLMQAPATNILFELYRELMTVAPSSLAFTAPVGGSDVHTLVVSNGAAATVAVNVHVASIAYDDAVGGWLSLAPAAMRLSPGMAVPVQVTASAAQLGPGTYRATITLATDDPNMSSQQVLVTFNVLYNPMLNYVGYVTAHDTDGDGHLESGETGQVYIFLANTNGLSDAINVQGILTALDPRVHVLGSGALAWNWIPASSVRLSDNGVWLSIDSGITNGSILPMRLDYWAPGQPVTNHIFNLDYGLYCTVSGQVLCTSFIPNTTNIAITTVTGAVVTATFTNGGTVSSRPTDTNGIYSMIGVPAGNNWFTVMPPSSYPYVAPAGTNIYLNMDPTTNANFMVWDYGTNSPHLVFYDATVDDSVLGDNDGGLDPGETVRVRIGVWNNGQISAMNVTGMLAVADMGIGPYTGPRIGTYMDVVDGADEAPTNIPASPLWQNPPTVVTNNGFTVYVHPDAKKGDMQRFWLWEADNFTPVRVWPMDFSLTVDPLLAIGGTVTFTNAADNTVANFSQVRVTATLPDGTTRTVIPGPPGVFNISRLPSGGPVTVSVTVPSGFIVLTNVTTNVTQVVDPFVNDVTNLVFRIGNAAFDITPPGIETTIYEGTSATNLLTFVNHSVLPATFDLSVSYERTPNEVQASDPALTAILAATPKNWSTLDTNVYQSGELEIRFQDNIGWMERWAFLQRHHLRALFQFQMIPAVVAVPEDTALALSPVSMAPLAQAIAADPDVKYVQPAVLAQPSAVPNDPLYSQQYALHNVRQTGGTLGADIGAETAWNTTTGSEEIVVAVCDTGVDITHDDLRDNIWGNPLDQSGDVNGDGYPGTRGVASAEDIFANLYYYNPFTGVLQGPEIPGNEIDDDGDGVIDETGQMDPDGIHLRDQRIMTADYNGDGIPTCVQSFEAQPLPGGGYTQRLVEVWSDADWALAVNDDDRDGYADDIHGWCFYDWDSDVSNHDLTHGHGTHVAGIIGARGNNGLGVCGVNWKVKIMPLCLTSKTKQRVYFTTLGRIAKAMEFAVLHGARVSNHSWGGSASAGVLYEIMKTTEQRYNHLFVIAAGNSGQNLDMTRLYPAYYSTVLNNVITVAATDKDDLLASFTCFGANSVQIAAPGVDILSTLPSDLSARMDTADSYGLPVGGSYGLMSGTSMATPYVTGAAALLWSTAPNANFEAVKKALLDGSRHDPNLVGWVKSGGHLDIARALRAFNTQWVLLTTNGAPAAYLTVPAGGSAQLTVTLNPARTLMAGDYSADILANSAALGSRDVPVTLHVLANALADFVSTRIAFDTDADGYAEPGETVSFYVSLRNRGSGNFGGLQGVLSSSTPGVTVTTNTASWNYLYSGDTGESLTPYTVVLPVGAPASISFSLTLTASGLPSPQTVTFTLPAAPRYRASGRVVDTAGAGVSNAVVEYWGALPGRVLTGTNGAYVINGLIPGGYHERAIPTNQARSAIAAFTVTNLDRALPNLVVLRPQVQILPTNGLSVAVQRGMSTNVSLVISNGATDAFSYRVLVMPTLRVGLFSDGTSLGPLAAPLRQMGFAVDAYTNNFAVVPSYDPTQNIYSVQQYVRYTWDDATVFQYDLVIADLSGPNAMGRLVTDAENAVFSNYVARGGTLLITGGNPLTVPDNTGLADLCGVAVTNRDSAATNLAVTTVSFPQDAAGRLEFMDLQVGERLGVASQTYDLATASNATVFFMAANANKLVGRVRTAAEGGGATFLWTGNANDADWSAEGAWQDVLRELVRTRFLKDAQLQTSLPWLSTSAGTGVVTHASVALGFSFNSDAMADPGDYSAMAVILGNYPGAEVAAVPVSLTVTPSTLRVFTSGQVTDWRGLPLLGDGGPASALFQVIYAGTNQVPQPPNVADGSPSGDDQLLATFDTGEAFGRFGSGTNAPDSGKFDRLFAHLFPAGSTGRVVYVRAWDAASFHESLAYGDSIVRHTMNYAPWEEADFGSWICTNVINYLRDSNGDSVPDGWIMKYRPDLDPRAAVTALVSAATATQAVAVGGSPYRAVGCPTNSNIVFVLDKVNNRLVVVPTNDMTQASYFRPKSASVDVWNQPEGLAADPRTNRIAVADTYGHRIMFYTYSLTDTGVTFALERQLATGTAGSATNQLNLPTGVGFDLYDQLFVADKNNDRVAVFRVSNGAWVRSFQGSGGYVLKRPQAVCVDTDLDGGVWVCDTGDGTDANHDRMTLYTVNGAFLRSFGSRGTGNGQFQLPVDVQVWRMTGPTNSVKRLLVADKGNNRVQLFADRGTNNAYLMSIGTGGTLFGQLNLPNGVWAADNQPNVLVADTGNNRIQWFNVVLDADRDGMPDFWEDVNGLDSTVNDANLDPDNDGLTNYGEWLTGSNPHNPDSNGNGGSDGWDVANGFQPDAGSHPVYPPHILSLTATPATNSAGGAVLVSVVFDQPVAATPIVLTLTGGVATVTSTNLTRAAPTNYTCVYRVRAGDLGAVGATISGAYSTNVPPVTQDPVVYRTNLLFTAVSLFGAGVDVARITATPAIGATGTNVLISVFFTGPVTNIPPPMFSLTNAATLPSTAMTNRTGWTNYWYVYQIQGSDRTGGVAVTLNSAWAVSGAPVSPYTQTNAFQIFFQPFTITALNITGGNMTWMGDAGGRYAIWTNSNLLVPLGWGFYTNVTGTNGPPFYIPASSQIFYRINRVNP